MTCTVWLHLRIASGDEETLSDVQDTDPLFLPESQDSLANSSSDSSTIEAPPPPSPTSEPPPIPPPPST